MGMEDQAEIDEPAQASKTARKSLAIDTNTYEMLRDICNHEGRTLIAQLKRMIDQEHRRLLRDEYH